MNTLPQPTKRRLKKIPQIPSVWEGDRRSLSSFRAHLESDTEGNGECIIWVDGSEGFVRAMDVVSPEMGPEAVVRTLLRAIETPHSPAKPARPQKIVVRNREIQFFLRGALQNLDIAIDYVPELPLIDELFRSFEDLSGTRPPAIPPLYDTALKDIARELWQAAPWEVLADRDVLAIELNRWDVETIYACVMGMLGKEYGVILYRSLDSLKRFRLAALEEKSVEQLEKAFLAQDCWFLNYEPVRDVEWEEEEFDLADLPPSQIRPLFGSVHPYEGIRPYLDEEEAKAVYVLLQALLRFFRASKRGLDREPIDRISKRYRIPTSPAPDARETIPVTVSTLPELSAELLDIMETIEAEEDEKESQLSVPLRDDLVPDNAFLSVGMVPWELVETLRHHPKIYYQNQGASPKGEGMPVVLIQTSRPKAKALIETLKNDGGLKAICFNPGEDPFTGVNYDLGIFQTFNENFYIFGEFVSDDPEHVQARKKWDRRCHKTERYCGLIVAMGVTGTSRGNPQLPDMMALFETKALDAKELAMGVLQLMPEFEEL
ncbi:hypothetical protein Ple7327_1984 [Pleurocapsa sp. PCC 7327]|uniref:DUF6930 domain-containing protein n=1 Tax=Pleurocapsa sp. PCC 7327 TaxID=118163 RepID=UPI00029FE627|nr:hypothetical protein [Pleurocapsa sp. PCC 7327]AFY77325.1 hypothetical protein Ple7327_1984 [Pleurocapsa sp. PCC 7327]